MHISTQDIISWILAYKYVIIFPVTVFEGPIVTVIAGFLSAHGVLNIFIVYPIIVLGDLVGDLFYYSLGRWGRDSFIFSWLRFFGITDQRIERLEKHYEKHSGKTLVIGKITHGIGSIILIAAGVAKMPVGRLLWINLLGTLPKSLLFLLIGFYFGEAYKRIEAYLDYTAKVTIIVAILLVVFYFLIVKIVKSLSKK